MAVDGCGRPKVPYLIFFGEFHPLTLHGTTVPCKCGVLSALTIGYPNNPQPIPNRYPTALPNPVKAIRRTDTQPPTRTDTNG